MTLPLGSATRRSPLPPLEDLKDLIARVDLYALVERYAGPGRASGVLTRYTCPNPHHPDHHPSFDVSPDTSGKLWARCRSVCQWHGDALAFVKWVERVDTAEGARRLRAFLGEPERFRIDSRPVPTVTPKAPSPAPKPLEDTDLRPSPQRARAFLEGYLNWRQWPEDIADRFQLEVVEDRAGGVLRVRHPYLVPTSSGEWIAGWWQDRGPRDCRPPWKNPTGSQRVLYNLPSLASAEVEAVVVCEGAPDAVTASLVLEDLPTVAVIGVPGAGSWKKEWADYLGALPVVVAADNDEAGRKLEQAVTASLGRGVVVVRPSHKDLSTVYAEQGFASLRGLLLSALGDLAPPPEGEILIQLEKVTESEEVASHE